VTLSLKVCVPSAETLSVSPNRVIAMTGFILWFLFPRNSTLFLYVEVFSFATGAETTLTI
jgi:hypothetical protein